MPTSTVQSDIWSIVLYSPQIDAAELAAAIEGAVGAGSLDFRTRLLIRDALTALARCWGDAGLAGWLSRSSARAGIELIRSEDLGVTGFPSLMERVMETTRPETVMQFLTELGSQIQGFARVTIGRSTALILSMRLVRRTEDVDVVDELPAAIRNEHDLLKNLAIRFGLHLAHFQSHYLPVGWDARTHSLGAFGHLQVLLVDPLDVLCSKVMSKREKDRDDLRALAGRIDKAQFADRLRFSCGSLLAEPDLLSNAQQNWYIVYGEPLPA